MMIDTHVHIDHFPDPYQIALEAEKAGIKTIAVTVLPSHFEFAYPHIRPMRNVRLALGLHPLYAKKHKEEYPLFEKHIQDTSYIGEVGLDFSRDGIKTKAIQIESFRFVLSCIRNPSKFISVHSRKAEEEVLQLLDECRVSPVVFHWYSGEIELTNDIVSNGHYFSINPAMVKSSKGLDLLLRIPRDRVLTETDGPFLKVGNVPAQPKNVRDVLIGLTKIWDEPLDTVEKQIENNFFSLLKSLKQKTD
jgi:TatD DNase family protein